LTAESPGTAGPTDDSDADADPDGVLWDVLSAAPDQGTPTAHLILATGMSRRTLYRRLGDHIQAGRVIQVSRGRYRAARPEDRNSP
jgi:hypothetical protein